MHSKDIIHRDIKLENIFMKSLSNVHEVYLSNFFISDILPYNAPQHKSGMRKCGTPGYIAPEIFKN